MSSLAQQSQKVACSGQEVSLHQTLHKLKKSSFVRNVLVVMFGTAVAQIISFALTPIISRLFSPTDFGVYGSFNAVAGVIAAGVTLEYAQAIVLPREKGDAINLFCVSCLVTMGIALICLVACLIAPERILSLTQAPGARTFALLIFATLVNGFNAALQAWCVRVKAFKQTSASQVIRSFSVGGTQIGLGYWNGGAAGLICGAILAEIIASLNLLLVFFSDLGLLWHEIRWDRMKRLAKEYRDFPMYAASQNVINSLSQGLPVLLLTHFYGIAIAGAYAFGVRILGAPMGLLLRALRQVLFQKACETDHQGGSLLLLFAKTTVGLFVLAIFPSLVLFLWAPQIFTWIFGPQWSMAGELSRSLVVWVLFASCNLPSVLFARLIRIQRTIFFYDLILLAGRILALIWGGRNMTASQAVMLFSVVGAAMNLFLILLVGYAIMKKEGDTNWGERIRSSLAA